MWSSRADLEFVDPQSGPSTQIRAAIQRAQSGQRKRQRADPAQTEPALRELQKRIRARFNASRQMEKIKENTSALTASIEARNPPAPGQKPLSQRIQEAQEAARNATRGMTVEQRIANERSQVAQLQKSLTASVEASKSRASGSDRQAKIDWLRERQRRMAAGEGFGTTPAPKVARISREQRPRLSPEQVAALDVYDRQLYEYRTAGSPDLAQRAQVENTMRTARESIFLTSQQQRGTPLDPNLFWSASSSVREHRHPDADIYAGGRSPSTPEILASFREGGPISTPVTPVPFNLGQRSSTPRRTPEGLAPDLAERERFVRSRTDAINRVLARQRLGLPRPATPNERAEQEARFNRRMEDEQRRAQGLVEEIRRSRESTPTRFDANALIQQFGTPRGPDDYLRLIREATRQGPGLSREDARINLVRAGVIPRSRFGDPVPPQFLPTDVEQDIAQRYYSEYLNRKGWGKILKSTPGLTFSERLGLTKHAFAERLFRRDRYMLPEEREMYRDARTVALQPYSYSKEQMAQFYRDQYRPQRREPITGAMRQSDNIGALGPEARRGRYLLPDGTWLTTGDHRILRDRMSQNGFNLNLDTLRYNNQPGGVQLTPEQQARLRQQVAIHESNQRARRNGTPLQQQQPRDARDALDRLVVDRRDPLEKGLSIYRSLKAGGPIGKTMDQIRDIRNFFNAVKNARKNGEITYNSWVRFTNALTGKTGVRDGVVQKKKDRFSSLGTSLDTLSDIYMSGANALDNTASLIDSFVNPVSNTISRWSPGTRAKLGRHGWVMNPTKYYWDGRRISYGVEKMLKSMHLTSRDAFDYNLFRRGVIEAMMGGARLTKYGELFDAWEDITGVPFEDTFEGVAKTVDSFGMLGLKAGAAAVYAAVQPGKTNMFTDGLQQQWTDFQNQMVDNWESIKNTAMDIPTNVFTNLVPVIPIYETAKDTVKWIQEHPDIEDWFTAGYDTVSDGLSALQEFTGSLISGEPTEAQRKQERLLGVLETFESTLQNIAQNDLESILDKNGMIDWKKLDTVTRATYRNYFATKMGLTGEQLERAVNGNMDLSGRMIGLTPAEAVYENVRKEISDFLTPILRKWSETTNKITGRNKEEMMSLETAILQKSNDPAAIARDIGFALETGTIRDSFSGRSIPLTESQRRYLEAIRPFYNTISSVVGGLEHLTLSQQDAALEQELARPDLPEDVRNYLADYRSQVQSSIRQYPTLADSKISYSQEEIQKETDIGKKLEMMHKTNNYLANKRGDKNWARNVDQAFAKAYSQLVGMDEDQRKLYAQTAVENDELDTAMRLFYNQYANGMPLALAAPHILEEERKAAQKETTDAEAIQEEYD